MDIFFVYEVGNPRSLGLQHHAGHGAFIKVEKKRCALAGGNHIHEFVKEGIRRISVKSYIGFGFQDGCHLVDHFKQCIGEVICHVHPVLSHSRKGDELAKARGDALVSIADHCVIGGVAMYPETFQDLFAKIPVHSLLEGVFPVGEKVLVNPAKGYPRPGIVFIAHDKHVIDPQSLHGLPEGSRGFPGDPVQILGHLQKLIFSVWICFLFCQFPAAFRICCSQISGHGCSSHHGLELQPFGPIPLFWAQTFISGKKIRMNPLPPHGKRPFITRYEMPACSPCIAIAVIMKPLHLLPGAVLAQNQAVVHFSLFFGETQGGLNIKPATCQ